MSAVIDSGEPRLREITVDDLDRVMPIEKAVYEFPWSLGIFTDCIRVGYYCVMLELDDDVVAYSVLSAAVEEAHLLNLCVNPAYQRNGYGRLLLEHMMVSARRLNAKQCFLEVRKSNHAAINLYHTSGFNQVSVRKQYYPAKNGREDALIFARDLESLNT